MANAETVEVVLLFRADGTMSAGIVEGTTPEQALPALEKFFKTLGVDGLPIEIITPPEQHVHGPKGQKVSFGSRTHSH